MSSSIAKSLRNVKSDCSLTGNDCIDYFGVPAIDTAGFARMIAGVGFQVFLPIGIKAGGILMRIRSSYPGKHNGLLEACKNHCITSLLDTRPSIGISSDINGNTPVFRWVSWDARAWMAFRAHAFRRLRSVSGQEPTRLVAFFLLHADHYSRSFNRCQADCFSTLKCSLNATRTARACPTFATSK